VKEKKTERKERRCEALVGQEVVEVCVLEEAFNKQCLFSTEPLLRSGPFVHLHEGESRSFVEDRVCFAASSHTL
jgi:hypothetical protein